MKIQGLMTALFLLAGITASAQHDMQMKVVNLSASNTKGICVLYPTPGSKVSGTVTFTQEEKGVRVVANLTGFEGKGKHGFHVHEYGDCSAPDATSAGGHYNPTMSPHGAPTDATRHEGDMGNIDADENGNAHLDYVDPMMTLSGPNSIIGRSVIVHKDPDDMKTQPTGNAGPRVACGVIGVAK